MKTFIAGTVGACLLLPISVGAQAQPVPHVLNGEPRYKVEAIRVRAIDELGYDYPFSDEILVIIRVPAQNVIIVSKIFEDFDTGEKKDFPPNKSCILPIAGLNPTNFRILRGDDGATWTCSADGIRGGFAFTVEMYEKDDGFFGIRGFFENCLYHFPPACRFSDAPPDAVDDLIGRPRTLVFPPEEFEAVMPNVGDTFEESIKLGCHYNEYGEPRVCHTFPGHTGPEYEFTWRITRLPDALPILHPTDPF